jgi:hypothetical protein
MDVTAPGTEVVAPCGVTFAFSPTFTLAIDARGTFTVTSTAPTPTMTMLRPLLELPFTKPTGPTVPAMDDVRVAEARSLVALLSAASALVTADWSEATRAALVWLAAPASACDAGLVDAWFVDAWFVAAWFVAAWLAEDWLVDPDGLVVEGTVALLPAVVMRTV